MTVTELIGELKNLAENGAGEWPVSTVGSPYAETDFTSEDDCFVEVCYNRKKEYVKLITSY